MARDQLTIGRIDGPDELTFGVIVDAAVDELGNIFVLDAFANELRWFDSSGTFRDRIGREGRGPGEWRQAESLTLGPAGRILVLDPGNRKLSVIERGRTSLTHRHDLRLPFKSSGVCVSNGRMFLAAVDQDLLVHEIDADGEILRSFGEIDTLPTPLRRQLGARAGIEQERRNVGRIFCDAAGRRLFLLQHATHVQAPYPHVVVQRR